MYKVVEVGFGKTSSGIMALGLATAAGHKFILAKISIRIEETEGRSIVRWFFVLELLEQSSAHKSYVILSNFQASEPRFELYSLSTSSF